MQLVVGEGYDLVYVGMAGVERSDAGVENKMDFGRRETFFEAAAQRSGQHRVADASKTND